jgi:NADPH-dependent 2,4-dienoyl-CoA reductase/sulfur reductase-like enzyme
MKKFELVIVGGGLASARAIRAYREAGGDGRIALLSEDAVLPYHRPPLSKAYLRDETDQAPFIEDEKFYDSHEVEVMLRTSVSSVAPAEHALGTTGGRLAYEHLLIATGARPRLLRVPGGDHEQVFALRSLADSAGIRDAAHGGERAVVVGGGFIGMEVAASLRQLGLTVTLIHMGHALFPQLGSRHLSDGLLDLFRQHGVRVLLEQEVARFGGADRLEYVETTSGLRVEAGLAVVGIGVVPNVALLEGSGIVVDNGIVVNERFETSVPDVYAAGDVANFFDPLYGRRRRIEHWSNANYHGTEVGKILARGEGGYDTVSSFFTEVFGLTIKVFGDTSGATELTAEGSLDSRYVASLGDRQRLLGAISVGQSEEVEALVKNLIADRAPADALGRDLIGGRSL